MQPSPVVVLAIVAGMVSSVAHRSDGGQVPAAAGTVEAYAGIVSLYRSGHAAEAVSEINRWRLDQIEETVAAVQGSWFSAEADRRQAEAAVLLHADTALRAWVQSAPIEHDLHLRLALELVSRLRAEGRAPHTDHDGAAAPIASRELYVALAAAELAVVAPRGATSVAEEGLRSNARDPELLLLAGIAQEMLSLTFVHTGRKRDEAASLRDAQKRFAAAHAAAPSFETRLRLGRLWARRGRTREAQLLLESARETARGPRQLYLAALFLGRVHELRQQPELAAQAYRSALVHEPRAQAAGIALAHVTETMAGPDAARLLVLETLAASPRQEWKADPWWGYCFPPPELQLGPLARLRERVSLP